MGGPPQGLDRLLLILQLSDSSFPSGMYTLSHGLEGLAQDGLVRAETLQETVHGILRGSIGPAESTAVALAWRVAAAHGTATDLDHTLAALSGIDRRLEATRLAAETRAAATRTGRQVLDLAAELVPDPLVSAWFDHVRSRSAPGSQSVAVGLVYARAGVGLSEAVAADLSAFVVSLAGAALRLRLADHRTAQHLVRGAAPVIDEVVDEAIRRPLAELGGFAPVLDIAQMRHETADARLFAS